MHCCEGLPEPVEFEPGADSVFRAAKLLPVVAVTAVQPGSHTEALKDAEEVSLRISLRVRKDQARVGGAGTAGAE
jgi:hypothetical protein